MGNKSRTKKSSEKYASNLKLQCDITREGLRVAFISNFTRQCFFYSRSQLNVRFNQITTDLLLCQVLQQIKTDVSIKTDSEVIVSLAQKGFVKKPVNSHFFLSILPIIWGYIEKIAPSKFRNCESIRLRKAIFGEVIIFSLALYKCNVF